MVQSTRIIFFIIQRVKAHAIPCPHQPPTRGDKQFRYLKAVLPLLELPGEEARRQLHKNAACNLEQVPAATPHKTPTVRPPAPYHENIQVRRTRHAGHCWRSRDELIRDVLLWTPTHGHAKAGRPARTYIQQLCEDTGCCPEDLP